MVHEGLYNKKHEKPPLSEEQIAEVREAFANKLEDNVTNSALRLMNLPLDLPEKIRAGIKIEHNNQIRGALAVITQDFQLTPEQSDFVKNVFLEQKPTEH